MNARKPWIDELRDEMACQKGELEQRLSRINANVRRPLDADSTERAAELENQQVVDALGNETTQAIAELTAAISRIDSGTFGYCEECGEPIGRQRLQARSQARKCIDCASLDET